jgi:glyoxylase I family protein
MLELSDQSTEVVIGRWNTCLSQRMTNVMPTERGQMNVKYFAPLLNVESVSRSIEFYRDHLGFRVTQEWEDDGRIRRASLETSGVRLMLNEPHDVDNRDRRCRHTYGDAVFYFTIDDVDSLHTRLNSTGILVGDLANEHYGMREFYVRDPDGYELGFGTPVSELKVVT